MSEVDGLAEMFRGSPVATGVQTRGKLIVGNDALASLVRASTAAIIGQPFLNFVAPEAHDLLRRHTAQRAAGLPAPARYMLPLLRGDGTTLRVLINVSSILVDGQAATLFRLYEVSHDIASSVDEASESFYRYVFEYNSAAKLIVDPLDGRIIDANSAACQFYGKSINDFRTMRVSDVTDDETPVHAHLLQHARLGIRRYFQCRHKTAHGIRNVDVHAGNVTLGVRDVLVLIVFDASEQRAHENIVRRHQRTETIRRLASGIRHELRNLAFVMRHAAQWLRQPASALTIAADLATIQQRGAAVLAQLSDVVLPKSNGPSQFDARALTRRVIETLRDVGSFRGALHMDTVQELLLYNEQRAVQDLVTDFVLTAQESAEADAVTVHARHKPDDASCAVEISVVLPRRRNAVGTFHSVSQGARRLGGQLTFREASDETQIALVLPGVPKLAQKPEDSA